MANPNPSAISAAFPAPPPFYKSFTPQNLDRLHELLEASNPEDSDPQQSAGKPSQKETSISLSLPPELRCLIPPPPPPEGRYRSFGDVHDVSSSLLIRCSRKPLRSPKNLSSASAANKTHNSSTPPPPPPPHPLHPPNLPLPRQPPRHHSGHLRPEVGRAACPV